MPGVLRRGRSTILLELLRTRSNARKRLVLPNVTYRLFCLLFLGLKKWI